MAKKKAKFKKGSPEAKRFMAKIRKMRKPAKKKAAKKKTKISGTTTLKVPTYRKNKSVSIKRNSSTGKFAKIAGTKQTSSINLNAVGTELLSLEFKINNLKAHKKAAKLIAEKKQFQNQITAYSKQFKELKRYLNTRAKFI